MIGRRFILKKQRIGILLLGLLLVSLMTYSQKIQVVYALGSYSSSIPVGGTLPTITTAIDGSGTLISGLDASNGNTVMPGQPGSAEFTITDSDAGNPVGSNVKIDAITITGPQPGAFTVTVTNLVSTVLTPPIDVTANGTVRVKVTCMSATPGSFTAVLNIDHDSVAVTDPATYNLACTVATPVLSVSTTPVSIVTNVNGTDASGNPNNITKITVANAGIVPATLSYSANLVPGLGTTAEIQFYDDPTDPDDDPLPLNNISIPAGTSRKFSIICSSAAAGLFSANVTVTSNAGAPNSQAFGVNCTVNGVPKFGSDPVPGSLIDFGSTQINIPVSRFVRVNNNNAIGGVALTVSSVFTDNAGVFQVQAPTSGSVPAGAQRDFEIRCRPTGVGTFNANLTIKHNNDGNANSESTYTLTCVGTPQEGVYSATTTLPDGVNKNIANGNTINLGNALVGANTTFAPAFTIKNTGSGTLFIASPDANPSAIRFTTDGTTNAIMDSTDPSNTTLNEFVLTAATTTPRDLVPNQNFDVGIICTPQLAGQRTVKLSVFFSPGTSPVIYLVTCTGTTPTPTISATPSPLTITGTIGGNVTQNITVGNTGGATLTVSSATISSNPAGILTLAAGGPSYPFDILAAGANRNIPVTCSLTAATTSATGTVTLNHNAGTGTTSIPINCNTTGIVGPAISTNPSPANGLTIATTANTPLNGSIVVSSTGGQPLSISGATFTPANAGSAAVLTSLTTPTFPLDMPAGGAPQTFQFRCNPTANGSYSGTFTITHNAPTPGSTTSITVTCNVGTVVVGPTYSSSPSVGGTISISAPLSTAGTATLTVTNNGTAPLLLSQPALGSTTQITLSSGPSSYPHPVTAGGGTATFTFSCTSSTASTYSTSVTIVHNAIGTPATYTISCTVANVTATPSTNTTATATSAPVSSTSVAPCTDNQVLSTPFPQNASGEFLLTNCFVVSTGGTVSITLAQVLTNPYSGVSEANIKTIQSNAGLMSAWRMGSWFLVPDLTYNASTQTYTFTSASGTNIYVFFYGGITRPVGSQDSSFAGTTTGNISDVNLPEGNKFPLAAVLSTAIVGFMVLIYASRRMNRNRIATIDTH